MCPSVTSIQASGMPWIMASSSAASFPSTISSMMPSALLGSSTLSVFLSRLVIAALTLSAQSVGLGTTPPPRQHSVMSSSASVQLWPSGAEGSGCPCPTLTRIPVGRPKMLSCSYVPATGAVSPGACSGCCAKSSLQHVVRDDNQNVGRRFDLDQTVLGGRLGCTAKAKDLDAQGVRIGWIRAAVANGSGAPGSAPPASPGPAWVGLGWFL